MTSLAPAGSPAFSSSRLAGRTALVTGSTSGIGAAIARTLAGEAATVVVSGPGRGPRPGGCGRGQTAGEQLTRSWAAEYGLRGMRVYTVPPGATLTLV